MSSMRRIALALTLTLAVAVLGCQQGSHSPTAPTRSEPALGGSGDAASTASSVTSSAQHERVDLCHRTGNGRYEKLAVAAPAVSAHLAHGDGRVGDAVPSAPGRVFDASCAAIIVLPPPPPPPPVEGDPSISCPTLPFCSPVPDSCPKIVQTYFDFGGITCPGCKICDIGAP